MLILWAPNASGPAKPVAEVDEGNALPADLASGRHDHRPLASGFCVYRFDAVFRHDIGIEPLASREILEIGFWSDGCAPEPMECALRSSCIRNPDHPCEAGWLCERRRQVLARSGARLAKFGLLIDRDWLHQRLHDLPLPADALPEQRLGRRGHERWNDLRYDRKIAAAAARLEAAMNDGGKLLIEAHALEVLGHAVDQWFRAPAVPDLRLTPADRRRLAEAHDILAAEWGQPPTIPHLSRRVGLNTHKLKAGFRQVYGITPYGFVTRCRMTTAHALLASGENRVSDVAVGVGFSNMSRFSAAFRRFFGYAPSDVQRG